MESGSWQQVCSEKDFLFGERRFKVIAQFVTQIGLRREKKKFSKL